MGSDSIFLLIGGMGFQGMPTTSFFGWLIIVFLALVNTVFAFTLWNFTMQTLATMESSILVGFMLVFIAISLEFSLGKA